MSERFDVSGHLYILLTLIFTVYGQLVLKWQMGLAGSLPEDSVDKVIFLLSQFLNPWIISGLIAALLASIAWMAAMTSLNLNYAYPFMSMAFIIVMIFSVLFLNEPITIHRIIGTFMVIAGLIVVAQA